MKTKVCGHCHKKLNINKFHLNSASKDGHTSICKECRRKYVQTKGRKAYREYQTPYQLEYYYKHKNEEWYKEKIKQYRKNFLKKHPNYYKNRNKNK